MFTSPSLAQRPSALALDIRREGSQQTLPVDAGDTLPGHVAPRGGSYRSRWRRRGGKLVRRAWRLGTSGVALRPLRRAR